VCGNDTYVMTFPPRGSGAWRLANDKRPLRRLRIALALLPAVPIAVFVFWPMGGWLAILFLLLALLAIWFWPTENA
jgi:hypothetical protein